MTATAGPRPSGLERHGNRIGNVISLLSAHPRVAVLMAVGFQVALGVLITLSFVSTIGLGLVAFVVVLALWCTGSCAVAWLLEQHRTRRRAHQGRPL